MARKGCRAEATAEQTLALPGQTHWCTLRDASDIRIDFFKSIIGPLP